MVWFYFISYVFGCTDEIDRVKTMFRNYLNNQKCDEIFSHFLIHVEYYITGEVNKLLKFLFQFFGVCIIQSNNSFTAKLVPIKN